MRPLVTILYEDSKIGREYPLHSLVLRMVEDDINGQTWRLRQAVEAIPKNGIDKALSDVCRTSLIAGAGTLFLLVDRDAIIKHVNQKAGKGAPLLASSAKDDAIVAAISQMSDAPERLRVFFLQPNMEGLIAAIAQCAPGQWTAEIASASTKSRLDGSSSRSSRDVVLGEVAKAALATVRACVRARQPGLDALAKALAEALPAGSIA